MEKERLDKFVFFRSYFDSISYLAKSGNFESYGKLLHVICSFVLNGEEPEEGFLDDISMALFQAFLPHLVSSRQKALAGAMGGVVSKGGGRPLKQAENKQKTSKKQRIKNKEIRIKNKEQGIKIEEKENSNLSCASENALVCVEEEDFLLWWEKFDKKRNKQDALKAWLNLSSSEKIQCLKVVDDYVLSTPDKSYRKDPITYINQKSFNDEIVFRNTAKKENKLEAIRQIALQERTEEEIVRPF